MRLTEREVVVGRFGRLRLFTHDDPPLFWVEAAGLVTPGLLRRDLAAAEAFGRERPRGWTYVVDTSAVRAVHPLNLLLLRRIRGLAHLTRYLVLAPRLSVRVGMRLARPIARPDQVFRRREALMAHLALEE